MQVKVLDISHHNTIAPDGFQQMAAFGIRGIIHKATQGTGYIDQEYAPRRQAALAAGLLWGAYHFATGEDVGEQLEHFLQVAQPDARTLMALDHEPNQGNELDLDGAKEFLEKGAAQLGRKLVLYSGNLIKEQLGDDEDAMLGQHRLWLAQYSSRPISPPAWPQGPWLWQFSDRPAYARGITVPGIKGNVDMNAYARSDAELAEEWAA